MNEFEQRFEELFGRGSLNRPFDFFAQFYPKNEPVCQFREVWHHHTCQEGYTYLAICGDLFKIGFTCGDLSNRLYAVSSKYGFVIQFYYAIKSNCPRSMEKYLHRNFAEQQVHGEFYRLSPTDLDWIKAINEFNGGQVEHIAELS